MTGSPPRSRPKRPLLGVLSRVVLSLAVLSLAVLSRVVLSLAVLSRSLRLQNRWDPRSRLHRGLLPCGLTRTSRARQANRPFSPLEPHSRSSRCWRRPVLPRSARSRTNRPLPDLMVPDLTAPLGLLGPIPSREVSLRAMSPPERLRFHRGLRRRSPRGVRAFVPMFPLVGPSEAPATSHPLRPSGSKLPQSP